MGVNITAEGRRTMVPEIEWLPRPDGTERAIAFIPGYNGDRTRDANKDFGVHGMEIWWYLRGPRGAAHFGVFTDWIPGKLYPGHGRMPVGMQEMPASQYPNGADLGYHARVPQWDGQEAYGRDDCTVIDGRCYGDGSGLRADALAKTFTELGEPAIWAALELEYLNLSTEAPDEQS